MLSNKIVNFTFLFFNMRQHFLMLPHIRLQNEKKKSGITEDNRDDREALWSAFGPGGI